MKHHGRQIVWTAVILAAWTAAGWAQQTAPPEPGPSLQVKGKVTKVMTSQRPPALEMKTAEGTTYVIHLGPFPNLNRQGFNPKVGEPIAVSGEYCCVVEGHQALRSREITLGAKTFTTPGGPPQTGAKQQGNPAATCCGGSPAECCAQGAATCPHCQMQQ